MLASAGWQLGVALEEFDNHRRIGRRARKGRCDLWIHTPGLDCVFEIKQSWNPADAEFEKEIKKQLASARRQALSILTEDIPDSIRFAACFVVPAYARSSRPVWSRVLQHRLAVIRNLRDVEQMFIAWSRNPHPKGGDRVYPGVLLVGEWAGDVL
jgi:hypothetical protein